MIANRRNSTPQAGSRKAGHWAARIQTREILAAVYPHGKETERRGERRYPYQQPIHLTPVGADGRTPAGESIVVTGKHLAEHGVGFFHQAPIPHRRMIASLRLPDGRWLGVLLELAWCRFTGEGWYESGGRFLNIVPSPMKSSD